MTFLLANWQNIVKGVILAVIAGLIYYYGYHIPNELKVVQKSNMELTQKLEEAQKAQEMLAEIQHAKNEIDRQTFKQISSIRQGIKPNTVVVPFGKLR